MNNIWAQPHSITCEAITDSVQIVIHDFGLLSPWSCFFYTFSTEILYICIASSTQDTYVGPTTPLENTWKSGGRTCSENIQFINTDESQCRHSRSVGAGLIFQSRQNLYLGMDGTSNGTTAAPPSMMLHIWDMLGNIIVVHKSARYTMIS